MTNFIDQISSRINALEEEEEANLKAYKLSHPEQFPEEERRAHKESGSDPSVFRTSAQKAKAARKAKRQRERKKLQRQIEATELGIDLSLLDRRVKRVKIYKIRTGIEKDQEANIHHAEEIEALQEIEEIEEEKEKH
jgi:hypothetical protein